MSLGGPDPALQDGLNHVAVLLHEHHVSVAADAGLSKLEVLSLGAASLAKEVGSTVVVGHVVGRLGSEDEDGLALQVDQTTRRRLAGLKNALNKVVTSAGLDLLNQVGGRVRDRGAVGEGDVSQTVGAGSLGAEDGVPEGRASGLKKNETLSESRAGVRDKNGHDTTLAVADKDDGSANLVEEGSASILDCGLLVGGIVDELNIGHVESVKDGVTPHTSSRPLGVLGSLGPEVEVLARSEALLNNLGRVGRGLRSASGGHPR